MTPELKRCPFCGGRAVIDGGAYYWIYCTDCKAETRGVHSKSLAVSLWNNRFGDDLLERMQDDGK